MLLETFYKSQTICLCTHKKKNYNTLQPIEGTTGQKKKRRKDSYIFQYKLSYRNETGTTHHKLLSTSV